MNFRTVPIQQQTVSEAQDAPRAFCVEPKNFSTGWAAVVEAAERIDAGIPLTDEERAALLHAVEQPRVSPQATLGL